MLVWLLKMEIGTNLINLEFWLWWASPGRNPDLRNRLRRRREKGLNDFRAGGDSGTAGTGRRGRLWFEAQSRTNPWWIERELLSFYEIGLNYSEQAELIEQFLVGSWFLWLFGIGPFFGDVREFAVFWAIKFRVSLWGLDTLVEHIFESQSLINVLNRGCALRRVLLHRRRRLTAALRSGACFLASFVTTSAKICLLNEVERLCRAWSNDRQWRWTFTEEMLLIEGLTFRSLKVPLHSRFGYKIV